MTRERFEDLAEIYGGDIERWPAAERGATLVGRWPVAGYEFTASRAVDGEEFLGLALDQHHQPLLSEARIDAWLAQIRPALLR